MSTDTGAETGTVNDDILRLIFEQYALEESEDSQLETLLLVCRQWRDTLLDYSILWGKITVIAGHRDTCDASIARAASRLNRSGPTTPLDISIIKDLKRPCKYSYNPTGRYSQLHGVNCCIGTPAITISRTLKILAGENGTICSRWRSLEIRHDSNRDYNVYVIDANHSSSMNALTYPTPSLVSLHLSWFAVDGPILPLTPNIKYLYLENVHAPLFLDLGNARTITYSCSDQQKYLFNLAHLESALRLHKLTFNVFWTTGLSSRSWIPLTFPELEDLTLTHYHNELVRLHAPKLRHLTLQLSGTLLSNLTNKCPGIPCNQIEHITLYHNMEISPETLDKLASFLIQLTSVKQIDADSSSSTLIIKLAWELTRGDSTHLVATIHPFHGREILLRTFEGDKELGEILLSGEETVEDLVEYARQRNLFPPEVDWWRPMEKVVLREVLAYSARKDNKFGCWGPIN